MRAAALGAWLAASTLWVLPAAPAGAADIDCSTIRADTPSGGASSPSQPALLLDVAGAQALVGGRPGSGQTVAVVDSGIVDSALLPRVTRLGDEPVTDFHGTAVAGLIAAAPSAGGAPVGVAPRARLIDVRVYDESPVTTQGARPPTPAAVAEGLRWVADNWRREGIGVVVVALAVPDDESLARAVGRLVRRTDVVVIAAAGNRPAEGEPLYAELGERRLGEDAGPLVFPAGYPGVVAVTATAEGAPGVDAREWVLPSSATDLAAPTYAAVSVGLNGQTCVLRQVATSWAAAQVAGVAALLRQRFPGETAAQIVARLVDTADGSPVDRTPMSGAGTVQPVEALTRPLSPAPDGTLPAAEPALDGTPAAAPPRPARSALPEVRDAARWWTLGGAGLVVLAVVLRPLLARSRPRSPGP